METQPKLNNSKEVIAYLAKQFPQCFVAEGEAKPLKIGIFQDLVKRLEGDPCVSKTQLRSALRLYTTSWRYLYGIKVGAERVDLDGNSCGVLEQEHVDFAREQLEQAKQRIKAQKKEKRQQEAEKNRDSERAPKQTKPRTNTKKPAADKNAKPQTNGVEPHKGNKQPKQPNPKPKQQQQVIVNRLSEADIANLKPGQKIKVKAGKSAMDATILEVSKEGARVQLMSGMSMVVRPEHLVL